jgi:hypothetical protein
MADFAQTVYAGETATFSTTIGEIGAITYAGAFLPQSTCVIQGQPPCTEGLDVTVPASGSLALKYGVFAKQPAVPSSFAYDIGATVRTSDGATTYATVATLTVTDPG